MLTPKTILFLALGIFAVAFAAVWASAARRARMGAGEDLSGPEGENERKAPAWLLGAVGFAVNFFGTLGIGSFATTTSLPRFRLTGAGGYARIPFLASVRGGSEGLTRGGAAW